jgi:VIT1/CCC1 family predicted Fe2+/Mn2+ transporter
VTTTVPDPIPPESTIALVDRGIAAIDRLVNARIDAVEKLADVRWRASQEATDKAERNVSKQLDATSAQVSAGLATLADKIVDMGARLNRGDGDHAGRAASQVSLITVVTLIIAVAAVVLPFLRTPAFIAAGMHP